MSRGLELRVLGGVDVRREGEVVRIGGPKPRLLLALLLAHRGSIVSTDRCCEELWRDAQPGDPCGVLQSHISRLRSLLRPDAQIVARPPGYVLEVGDDCVDAGRFERVCRRVTGISDPKARSDALETALACWRGSAFEEFADLEWGRREAVRLDELRVKAYEDLVDARLALGQHAHLVGELEGLVARHPLRERFWQQLIIALYRCDRSADALRRSAALRAMLRDELGLEPSPALRDLEGRVLADDPTLHAPAARTGPRRPRRLPTYPRSLSDAARSSKDSVKSSTATGWSR